MPRFLFSVISTNENAVYFFAHAQCTQSDLLKVPMVGHVALLACRWWGGDSTVLYVLHRVQWNPSLTTICTLKVPMCPTKQQTVSTVPYAELFNCFSECQTRYNIHCLPLFTCCLAWHFKDLDRLPQDLKRAPPNQMKYDSLYGVETCTSCLILHAYLHRESIWMFYAQTACLSSHQGINLDVLCANSCKIPVGRTKCIFTILTLTTLDLVADFVICKLGVELKGHVERLKLILNYVDPCLNTHGHTSVSKVQPASMHRHSYVTARVVCWESCRGSLSWYQMSLVSETKCVKVATLRKFWRNFVTSLRISIA